MISNFKEEQHCSEEHHKDSGIDIRQPGVADQFEDAALAHPAHRLVVRQLIHLPPHDAEGLVHQDGVAQRIAAGSEEGDVGGIALRTAAKLCGVHLNGEVIQPYRKVELMRTVLHVIRQLFPTAFRYRHAQLLYVGIAKRSADEGHEESDV